MKLEELKTIVQSANLNIIVGSGCSVPFLGALGNIETLLTDLNEQTIPQNEKDLIRATILKNYFDISIDKNLNLLSAKHDLIRDKVLLNYENLLSSLYTILLYRRSNLIAKQLNLFTTNMDVCLEVSAEKIGIELNDGFKGRIKPKLDLSQFKKIQYKKSQLYDLKSEIPSINCYKLHGSVNWMLEDQKIYLDNSLNKLSEIKAISLIKNTDILDLFDPSGDTKSIATLVSEAKGKTPTTLTNEFLQKYDHLPIINPTKEKFKETTLNYTHYELIRILSNELEKENSVLFVMGFSFADEHFQEIILRVANSNPTLKVVIFAYSSSGEKYIEDNLDLKSGKNIYDNISFVERENASTPTEEKFDLKQITEKYFINLASEVKSNFSK
jgi:hypothetical protein